MQDTNVIRLLCFMSLLATFMLWQHWRPARTSSIAQGARWRSNFVLMLSGAVVGRFILPAGLVGISLWAQEHSIGVFNGVSWALWIEVMLCLIALDAIIYWQHRAFHRWPLLWRMHRVHHADPLVDVSTGVRFHPLEIAISLFIKVAAVLTLGVAPIAIILFEIILNGTSLFNHTNVRLPSWLERPLRWLIVTQAMHRIHHSRRPEETNSNYGFNLSVWDRLFGSYTHQAQLGDEKVELGLRQYSKADSNTSLKSLLLMPFRR